jgi:hypothetical protein
LRPVDYAAGRLLLAVAVRPVDVPLTSTFTKRRARRSSL